MPTAVRSLDRTGEPKISARAHLCQQRGASRCSPPTTFAPAANTRRLRERARLFATVGWRPAAISWRRWRRSVGGVVRGPHVARDAAPVGDLVTLGARPLAHLRGTGSANRSAAAA